MVQNLRIALIKMFISLKLIVWHLSRRIVRMESAERWAAIHRKKPSRDWLEKDQWESVISVQSLSCIQILFGQNQTACPQIYPFLLFFPKTLTSCSSVQIFHPDSYPVSCFWFSHWTSSFTRPYLRSTLYDSRFSILAQGCSPFHLSALEATFIKTSNPAFCRQKKFVYSLKIVH